MTFSSSPTPRAASARKPMIWPCAAWSPPVRCRLLGWPCLANGSVIGHVRRPQRVSRASFSSMAVPAVSPLHGNSNFWGVLTGTEVSQMSNQPRSKPIDYDLLMQANLARVFGENNADKRINAIRQLYTEDAVLNEADA